MRTARSDGVSCTSSSSPVKGMHSSYCEQLPIGCPDKRQGLHSVSSWIVRADVFEPQNASLILLQAVRLLHTVPARSLDHGLQEPEHTFDVTLARLNSSDKAFKGRHCCCHSSVLGRRGSLHRARRWPCLDRRGVDHRERNFAAAAAAAARKRAHIRAAHAVLQHWRRGQLWLAAASRYQWSERILLPYIAIYLLPTACDMLPMFATQAYFPCSSAS